MAQTAADRLTELLAKLGVDATISASDTQPQTLQIETDDPAQLIGHRGEVIDAIQLLLRVMLHQNDQDASVIVDVDGYRERQHDQLREMARRKAQEVRETGRSAILSPMTSYERRLIHVELKDAEGVITESLGQGGDRRVVIKQD
jgi:spoIIIJ-associated protein